MENTEQAARHDLAYAQGGLDALNAVMGRVSLSDHAEHPIYAAVELQRANLQGMASTARATLKDTPAS